MTFYKTNQTANNENKKFKIFTKKVQIKTHYLNFFWMNYNKYIVNKKR